MIINNYHNDHIQTKKKKNHIMLNFIVHCMDYRLLLN